MRYDAIAIDTSVFIKYGLNLESGLLKQLGQFKNTSVDVIISDIVEKEVLKHLSKNIRDAQEQLNKALNESKRNKILSEKYVENILSQLAESSAEAMAKNRFESFKESVGLIVISSNNVDLQELISKYFDSDLPFEDKKDKKNEFPDAIALLSIEKWVDENNKHACVVSIDDGWIKYSDNSCYMTPTKDLAEAIEKLLPEPAVQRAIEAIRQVIADYDAEAGCSFLYDDTVCENDSSVNVYADSSVYYEIEHLTSIIDDLEYVIDEKGLIDIKVLSLSDSEVVFELGLVIHYTFSIGVSFQIDDSRYVNSVVFASGSKERSIEHCADAIIRFTGLFSDEISKDCIIGCEIEIVNPIKSVNFGDIDTIWQNISHYD
ncbi:MAG: PIN domain-containing protein [Deferribacterales bacterium]